MTHPGPPTASQEKVVAHYRAESVRRVRILLDRTRQPDNGTDAADMDQEWVQASLTTDIHLAGAMTSLLVAVASTAISHLHNRDGTPVDANQLIDIYLDPDTQHLSYVKAPNETTTILEDGTVRTERPPDPETATKLLDARARTLRLDVEHLIRGIGKDQSETAQLRHTDVCMTQPPLSAYLINDLLFLLAQGYGPLLQSDKPEAADIINAIFEEFHTLPAPGDHLPGDPEA